jgi:hypothetical protein
LENNFQCAVSHKIGSGTGNRELHKKVSQACAKNGGGDDKEGSKPTVIPTKTGNACLHNITMRRVHPTTVALEKQ